MRGEHASAPYQPMANMETACFLCSALMADVVNSTWELSNTLLTA
jgi:hypothetical protein